MVASPSPVRSPSPLPHVSQIVWALWQPLYSDNAGLLALCLSALLVDGFLILLRVVIESGGRWVPGEADATSTVSASLVEGEGRRARTGATGASGEAQVWLMNVHK